MLQQLGGHLEISGEVRDVKSWGESRRGGVGVRGGCAQVSYPQSESPTVRSRCHDPRYHAWATLGSALSFYGSSAIGPSRPAYLNPRIGPILEH